MYIAQPYTRQKYIAKRLGKRAGRSLRGFGDDNSLDSLTLPDLSYYTSDAVSTYTPTFDVSSAINTASPSNTSSSSFSFSSLLSSASNWFSSNSPSLKSLYGSLTGSSPATTGTAPAKKTAPGSSGAAGSLLPIALGLGVILLLQRR